MASLHLLTRRQSDGWTSQSAERVIYIAGDDSRTAFDVSELWLTLSPCFKAYYPLSTRWMTEWLELTCPPCTAAGSYRTVLVVLVLDSGYRAYNAINYADTVRSRSHNIDIIVHINRLSAIDSCLGLCGRKWWWRSYRPDCYLSLLSCRWGGGEQQQKRHKLTVDNYLPIRIIRLILHIRGERSPCCTATTGLLVCRSVGQQQANECLLHWLGHGMFSVVQVHLCACCIGICCSAAPPISSRLILLLR